MTIEVFISNLVRVIINPLIGFMFAVALAYFIWGVINYIKGADSDSDRQTGSRHILWGIIGLIIMVSVYSILNIAMGTFFGFGI